MKFPGLWTTEQSDDFETPREPFLGLVNTKSYLRHLRQWEIFQKLKVRNWNLKGNDLITCILLAQVD